MARIPFVLFYSAAAVHMSSNENGRPSTTKPDSMDLLYRLNDRPPWYLCPLLGFQSVHCELGLVYESVVKTW
ncbi:hypothetical protein RRG08_022338 [Elysia crispata]|uniref:Uncharacterized protein n=1 Tax=Elysia crispata TaxID=231223 RepID=A0AAE0Z1L7_9GAST|nr:hypothetical protein RRG08_022338 [Elysia crispata]